MATSQLSTINFKVDDDGIEFFGFRGLKLNDNRWAVNAFGDTLIEVEASSIMDTVRSCIDYDVRTGNGDDIAMLVLLPQKAVTFYLEGGLTREHLEQATDYAFHTDVPNVTIEGRTLTVRIQLNATHTVATADAEGNVL